MKKKIIITLTVVTVMMSLTGCGKFKCDICGQEKSGKSYSVEVFGQQATLCKDCYDEMKELQEELQDLFD